VIDLSDDGRAYLKAKGEVALELVLSDELHDKVRFGGLERLTSKPSATRLPDDLKAEPETGSTDAPHESADTSDPLYQRLKDLRLLWAREANVAAFRIFTNKTLETLVSERPGTPHELAAIKGVSPVIRERYGAMILEAVLDPNSKNEANLPIAVRSQPATSPDIPVQHSEPTPHLPETPSGSRTYVPTEEWTWRLIDRGFDLEEASAIRGLELSTILRHTTLMARKGRKVAIERWVPAEVLRLWEEQQKSGETAPPAGTESIAGLWSLFLACRASQG
jgi:ATP-dependent DNA helicase RecQ